MDNHEGPLYWFWSPNQVVAYNLARAREAMGWSQEEAGRRLEPHLGVSWSKATFSQAERSVDPGRSRGFTADEIVAFSRCFGLPVTWFFFPPPPGTPGIPHRAETGETVRQYSDRLNALLSQVFGTPEQADELMERIGAFAAELTPKTLADARDVVAETAGALVFGGPSVADELRRWREALLGVAEGLGAIEAEVERRREAEAEVEPERDLEQEWEGFDLSKIDLPLPSREQDKARERDLGRDFGLDLGP